VNHPIVVITASEGSFPELPMLLSEIPVAVESRPLIRFEAPADWGELDAALARLDRFESVALTSPRAARAVADRMRLRRKEAKHRPFALVWATGKATADALGDVLGPVQLPPPSAGSPAAALARAMLEGGCHGPVLFPCGEDRREELPEILRAALCPVEEVICYRSVPASRAEAATAAGRAGILVVASPSVMKLLAESCPPARRPQLVAIGPTTATAAHSLGWPPDAVAGEPSSRGVASAVASLLVKARQ
jgi:uroporphyrinogen III methyltransferase / synthase